jgi:hypothetical protein
MALSRTPTQTGDHRDEEHGDHASHPGPRAFLPHTTDDGAISTRGQALPSLLHNLSSTNITPRRTSSWRYLSDLGKRVSGGGTSDSEDSPRKLGGIATSVRSQRRYSNSSTEDEDGVTFGRRPVLGPQDRRLSNAAMTLMTPEMRSQRLIGNSNPRYRWEQYFKTEEELKKMKKPMRVYSLPFMR